MLRLGLGLTEEEFVASHHCYTVINTNSPRQLDIPMALGLIQFAEMKSGGGDDPFHPGRGDGTSDPGRGTGSPTCRGPRWDHLELRSPGPEPPSSTAPLPPTSTCARGHRPLGLLRPPKRPSPADSSPAISVCPGARPAVCTSNTPDAQAGYESMMNMMGAALGGANFILHTAGWLESGLSASFEKFILDVEMAQMFAEMFMPLDSSRQGDGARRHQEVQPGGHFFGIEHTLERYETAFYEPVVFSRSNFGQWDGGWVIDRRSTSQHGSGSEVLADFEPPPLDDGIRHELDDFVARRTAEGGAPPES